MNFQHAKDELLKWLIPALLGVIWMTLSDLKSDMVAVKKDSSFATLRLDKQADKLNAQELRIQTNDNRITRLETKLFK